MAEAVLFNIAEKILGKLGSLAYQGIGLLLGVKGELKKLENTISTIRDVLLDAEVQYQNSQPGHQIRGWLAKLKDAVYEADDLLDEVSIEALRRKAMAGNKAEKEVRLFFSSSNQLAFGLKMGQKIKKIRETLDAIDADRAQFNLVVRRDETQVVARNRDQTYSHVCEDRIIGREKDKEDIINRLLDPSVRENISIIPIVGMGGLGKTTLAQLVYNDENVKFEPKLWVCVSHNFDLKVIVKKIIESATKENPQDLEMETLINLLKNNIGGRKYLLVLDDVWEENRESWISLEDLLKVGGEGSRIIVTTRSRKVAEKMSRVSPYFLEGLPENESWTLFKKFAFEGQELNNPDLVAIGEEIVRKCRGVPLAIRAVGSLLYSQNLESEWKSINKKELSEINQQEISIFPVLKLSYDNLPSHLKHCFAYCSLFPKDHEIDVETLINLWIGQGFIKSSNQSSCLEIGLGCFKDLLWRSFFQEVKEDELGHVRSCKMHDLMHDLAVLVAGMESTILSSNAENIPVNTRHVSIDYYFYSLEKIPVSWLKAKKIRTFLLIKGSFSSSYLNSSSDLSSSPDEEIWSHAIVSKFRRLRMLDLHHLNIRRVPHSISKLKYLRYLDLSDNDEMEMLPSSIARLQNLLVLKLSKCWSLKELPQDIKKLVSLTHLQNDGCDNLTHMPQGLGQLTSLEKLTKFIVSRDYSVSERCGGLNELDGLNNLRGELKIENLSHVKNADSEYKAANLEGKKHLQSLILEWERVHCRIIDIDFDAMSMEGLQPNINLKKLKLVKYPGVSFPSWMSSLTNLVKLKLSVCPRVKHLLPLDGLTSLRHLSIKDLSNLEYIDFVGSNCTKFFSSLEDLKIRGCPKLKGWRNIVSMDTARPSASTTELPPFPCLSRLEIQNCNSLTLMPPFPSIEGNLRWQGHSGKPLQQTMMLKSNAAFTCTSSSSSPLLPLSKLKSLWIKNVHDLEYLPHQGMRNLTSLQSLSIEWCNGLLSLEGEGFIGLTSLRDLEISDCPRLKSIAGVFQHCTALEALVIKNCGELDCSIGIHCQGLRSLSCLNIRELPQLVSLPKGLQHVTTLKSLTICNCERLRTLSPVFENLIALERLYINSCDELDLSDLGIQFQTCDSRSLQSLDLVRIPKLVSLPEWLQHFSTLQVLCIIDCAHFTTLPNWIGSLTSLQELKINFCREFTSFPEEMCLLTSLQKLSIMGCPDQLVDRCRKNLGVDWPNIHHIPNIEIDHNYIQLNGSSIASIDRESES